MDDDTIRLYLHTQLAAAFPDLALYYRPSGNLQISRPCLIYEPKAYEPSFSLNETYAVGVRFQVTILSDLPGYSDKRNVYIMPGVIVSSSDSYVSSDIVHDVFTVSVNSIR